MTPSAYETGRMRAQDQGGPDMSHVAALARAKAEADLAARETAGIPTLAPEYYWATRNNHFTTIRSAR